MLYKTSFRQVEIFENIHLVPLYTVRAVTEENYKGEGFATSHQLLLEIF